MHGGRKQFTPDQSYDKQQFENDWPRTSTHQEQLSIGRTAGKDLLISFRTISTCAALGMEERTTSAGFGI